MTLSRPQAVITVNGRRLTATEAGLARLRVSLGVTGAHDALELLAWPGSKLAKASSGDRAEVAIGESGDEADVWSGELSAVAVEADGLSIEGLAPTAALSRTRVSRTWVKQTVADVVRDLAGSLDVDEVQGTAQLEVWSVDDRRPVWAHLLELAGLAGADLGCSAAGGLRFVPVREGQASKTFRYGAELLRWRIDQGKAAVPPGVFAHGAGSEAGAERWHWVLRDPVGSGGGAARIESAFRTKAGADALAKALEQRAARAAVRGELVVPGEPEVRPGDLVAVSDLPSGDPGTLRVLRVDHVLDSRFGFYTTLTVEGAGGAAGLGGLL